MSSKRMGESEHRTSVRENTSYSRTLNKKYIGLSSQTRLHYRQSKIRNTEVLSESGVSHVQSARSKMSKMSDSRNHGVRSSQSNRNQIGQRFQKIKTFDEDNKSTRSQFCSYNDFFTEQLDSKHDSVAASLFRIHDKLNRTNQRKKDNLNQYKRQLSDRHLMLSDRKSSLS